MTDKKEGHLAAAIRMFLETPRSDEETVAYIVGMGDVCRIIDGLARGVTR